MNDERISELLKIYVSDAKFASFHIEFINQHYAEIQAGLSTYSEVGRTTSKLALTCGEALIVFSVKCARGQHGSLKSLKNMMTTPVDEEEKSMLDRRIEDFLSGQSDLLVSSETQDANDKIRATFQALNEIPQSVFDTRNKLIAHLDHGFPDFDGSWATLEEVVETAKMFIKAIAALEVAWFSHSNLGNSKFDSIDIEYFWKQLNKD